MFSQNFIQKFDLIWRWEKTVSIATMMPLFELMNVAFSYTFLRLQALSTSFKDGGPNIKFGSHAFHFPMIIGLKIWILEVIFWWIKIHWINFQWFYIRVRCKNQSFLVIFEVILLIKIEKEENIDVVVFSCIRSFVSSRIRKMCVNCQSVYPSLCNQKM